MLLKPTFSLFDSKLIFSCQLTPKWEVPDLSRRDVQLSKDLEKHITNVTSVLNESLHSLTTQLEQTDVSGTVLSLLQMSIDLLKTPTTHSTRDLIHKRLLGLNPIQILSIVVDLLQQVLSQVSGTALDTLGRIINQLQDLIKQLSA